MPPRRFRQHGARGGRVASWVHVADHLWESLDASILGRRLMQPVWWRLLHLLATSPTAAPASSETRVLKGSPRGLSPSRVIASFSQVERQTTGTDEEQASRY